MRTATVLVTGSSGYVGSHTVKYLFSQGYRVIGLDSAPPTRSIRNYLADELVTDISSPKVVDLIQRNRVEGVIHCAAKCLVGESVKHPKLYQEHNVIRSSKFVENMIRAGVKPIVFSSTAATYGEPKRTPIPEDHPQDPINPYGETKLLFEKYLLKQEKAGNLQVGVFRYFNAAGADPEAEIGEVHDPETHLIPNAIFAVLGKKKEFSIFGSDYPTRDGTCERDYVHVWDLAKAHLTLLERIIHRGEGGIFNLGTSKGYTVSEVIDEVEKQSGKKMKRLSSDRRPGDPAILVADSAKAREELKWVPSFSSLETIVETALRFHKKKRKS